MRRGTGAERAGCWPTASPGTTRACPTAWPMTRRRSHFAWTRPGGASRIARAGGTASIRSTRPSRRTSPAAHSPLRKNCSASAWPFSSACSFPVSWTPTGWTPRRPARTRPAPNAARNIPASPTCAPGWTPFSRARRRTSSPRRSIASAPRCWRAAARPRTWLPACSRSPCPRAEARRFLRWPSRWTTPRATAWSAWSTSFRSPASSSRTPPCSARRWAMRTGISSWSTTAIWFHRSPRTTAPTTVRIRPRRTGTRRSSSPRPCSSSRASSPRAPAAAASCTIWPKASSFWTRRRCCPCRT